MTHLVLIAHGSRDTRLYAAFETLVQNLQKETGANKIHLCYMQFTSQTLADIAQEAVQDGCRKLLVLPLFMTSGKHVLETIPAQADQARATHPDLEINILPPVGEHPEILEAIKTSVRGYTA